MSSRSIRRAAERLAAKQAHKNAPAQIDSPATAENATQISEARLMANRANAQLSTGPTSEGGKGISCLNAVKTGLTGQTVLLPSDDVARYEALIQSLAEQYKPVSDNERRLVQSLGDTQWRLNRVPGLESALFTRGRIEFAEKFASYEPELAAALMDSETLVVYAKQLRNLHTQEGRLRRQYAQDLAALTALLQERANSEQLVTPETETSKQATASLATSSLGFEFATVDFTISEQPCIASAAHEFSLKNAA